MSSSEYKTPAQNKRLFFMLLLTVIFILIGGAYAAYWFMYGQYSESTDNAYIAGDIVQITPLVTGIVQSVNVSSTDYVKEGTVLVSLDKTDTKLALEQAEAQLAQTVRRVRTLYTTDSSMKSVVDQRKVDLDRARKDLKRRLELAGTGAISGEEIEHAKDAVTAAQKALNTAEEQLRTNQSLTANTEAEKHPEVEAAAAKIRKLYIDYKRTDITAPVSGYVGMKNVQAGQFVQAGAPLMALVPLENVWVDANFKETQLENMRIGQPVELTSDKLGGGVTYHGKITGFSAGTGSVFSLIPAQNATGNWIKVIQRLAVRISIDPQELKANPLQIGLSMIAKVNVRDTKGAVLATGQAVQPQIRETEETAWLAEADALIQQIITDNK